jgi:uncharacterized membrane protein
MRLMDLATLTYLHLLLNHLPTIGFSIGLGLLFVAFAAKSDDVKRVSFVIFFIIGLLTIPAYMTGKAAQQAITGQDGVSDVLIEAHQDAALLATVFMEITAFLAWLGLWQFRRISRLARWNSPAVLVLSIVTFALMARAANIGGEIRHAEIRPSTATVEAAKGWLNTASIAAFVNTTPWAWPATETLHFIGLCLLLGVVLAVNLRMLGVMKNVSFAALHKLLPWAILGFAINVITGILFFLTVPEQYTQNRALQWKMLLILLAAANILYFTMFEETWAVRSGEDAPFKAKIIAALTIFLWVGVIYLGRMMPFIGGSF